MHLLPFKLNKEQKVRTFTFVYYSFGVSPFMHIASLAFGFPLATCQILYSRIIFKIEYFYFLSRIDEWSFEKNLGLHHVHNILGFHYTIMQ